MALPAPEKKSWVRNVFDDLAGNDLAGNDRVEALHKREGLGPGNHRNHLCNLVLSFR
jgi:hypothetical protein